ncbi:MAG TPA: bifunctional glycosyltransferase/class I SAM-dependent methyltransferase [Actinomycetota bacterium]|nr:bifunctional glycosyltransferase/class I SAM-dependent methyltransferase [Actinomycetota bacterium]
MPKIVITMPAYEAERTLERTVTAIPAHVADELILVDDASKDRTAELARALGIKVHVHQVNRGYGGNQKSCYTMALGSHADIIVLLHPDYQYEPKAVPLLIAPILAGDADMTFGSRFAGMGDPLAGGMPLYRYIGNRITTTAQNALLGTRFTDMHSGMRAYTRACLESLPFLGYSEAFAFDAELLVDAVTAGQRVVEVPIPTRYTDESSSISISRSLDYVTRGTLRAAERAVTRGRRGRRYIPAWRQAPRIQRRGRLVHVRCIACANPTMRLRFPATATGDVPLEEFRCTTSALSVHDDILECGRCGLLSSRTSLSADDIAERYEQVEDTDYFAEEAERRDLFEWVTDRIEDHFLRGRRLLEIGANVGMFLDVAARRGFIARGVDPSGWAVDQGRQRFGVDLQQGTIETLSEPDGDADVVAMLDVLEHLVDPVAALRRVRRAVADDGLLALATVNVDGLHGRLRRGSWPWFIRSHLHYFRPETLCRMLEQTGFRPIEWRVVPRSFHLSYILHRAQGTFPGSDALAAASQIFDPKIPVGWLGDVALVLARPDRRLTRE